jgi:hypothetical protein
MTGFAVTLLLGVFLGYLITTLPKRPQLVLTTRPLSHVYGAAITVDAPHMGPTGEEKGIYYAWCYEGYMSFSNGFKETSPIVAHRDERCEGVH